MAIKTNVKVGSVVEKKRGESKYGEWIMFNIQIDGDYYTFFGDGQKKFPPAMDDILTYVKYKEEQNGEYLNKTIEEFEIEATDISEMVDEVVEDSGKTIVPKKPESSEVPKGEITFYLGYAARLIAAKPEVFGEPTKGPG